MGDKKQVNKTIVTFSAFRTIEQHFRREGKLPKEELRSKKSNKFLTVFNKYIKKFHNGNKN